MNQQNLTYGQALEAVKMGKLIAREGWNGKGMFVFMRPAQEVQRLFFIEKVKTSPQSVKDYFAQKPVSEPGTTIKFSAYLCMKAADDSIVNGWLASQTDMLSNDWCVLD